MASLEGPPTPGGSYSLVKLLVKTQLAQIKFERKKRILVYLIYGWKIPLESRKVKKYTIFYRKYAFLKGFPTKKIFYYDPWGSAASREGPEMPGGSYAQAKLLATTHCSQIRLSGSPGVHA